MPASKVPMSSAPVRPPTDFPGQPGLPPPPPVPTAPEPGSEPETAGMFQGGPWEPILNEQYEETLAKGSSTYVRTYRLATPGGWVVRTDVYLWVEKPGTGVLEGPAVQSAVVYVPDQAHSWAPPGVVDPNGWR